MTGQNFVNQSVCFAEKFFIYFSLGGQSVTWDFVQPDTLKAPAL